MRFLGFIILYILLLYVPHASAQNHAFDRYYDVSPSNTYEDTNPFVQEIPDDQYHSLHVSKNALPAFKLKSDDVSFIGRQGIPTSPSRIEAYYASRIIDELDQFGYDMFASGNEDISRDRNGEFILPTGAVQDDFVLNIGDRLRVTLRGQINQDKAYPISNDGNLVIDRLPPISAAGQRIDDVELKLRSVLSSALPNTEAYISLDKVRQIGVLVIGDVKRPGRQNLTVFHSVLDALNAAGGIEKDGSLRQIKLVRRGQTRIIDLYALLLHGSDHIDLTLQDGDRLIIPPIGPTIAVSGNVKRPGIYEIRTELRGMRHSPSHTSEILTLQDMLDLSGGVMSPGQNRFIHMELLPNGKEVVDNISDSFKPVFKGGSVLTVAPTDELRQGQIELAGHSRKNGLHALHTVPTLAKLLDDAAVLSEDTYPLIGVIERYNIQSFGQEYISFPLSLVIKGQYDERLQDGDVIHLFSSSQIHNLFDTKKMTFYDQSLEVGSAMPDMSYDAYIDDPVLADVLREHSVYVKGAVRLPGAYPVAQGSHLEGVLSAAGGTTLDANISSIEITSYSKNENGAERKRIDLNANSPVSITVQAGDTIRINQKAQQLKDTTVLVSGEVLQPGEYNLMPGDTLLSLLHRAGGLTPQAYPVGAIFSRARERKREEQHYHAVALELERNLALVLDSDDNSKKPNAEQIAMARSLAKDLREVQAVGRITVEASPDVLLTHPELDVLLEPGDRLYIPKRPSSVRVRGEVLSPANLQFRSGKDPRDYIMEAGGFTRYSDEGRTFVVYPDGSAQPLQVERWNFKPVMVPPGATIVVPRDPKPLDFMKTAKDISEIFSNLAITGIVIDDIRDDD
jgi:polysaccharide biosynthesis/export protein